MKQSYLLLTFLLHCVICFSQKENNFWYFGNKSGVDFNSGSPVNLEDGKLTAYEGSSTISNASGQLLFYTNGNKIWNRNHEVMPNGSGLKGDLSSTQSALLVPKPGSSVIYYLFTSTGGYPNGLTYSEIDITLDGGLGDITINKNIQLYTPVCEKICAVKNNFNDSYWLLSHAFGSNSFLAYKIDASGLNPIPITSNVGSVTTYSGANFNASESIGHLKIAPDASKIVSVNFNKNTEIFDFNLMTGQVSNPVLLNTISNWSCYGAEFSPSGKRLYLTGGSGLGFIMDTVLQYDLDAVNIAASETVIKYDGVKFFGTLQLGPDCKIYANSKKSRSVFVINNPDALGLSCDFQPTNILLKGLSNIGLPNFVPNADCTPRAILNDDICLGGNINFSISGRANIIKGFWDFGDGNTSNSVHGVHQYTAAGTYTVSGNFSTPTANFIISKQITVPENPIAHPVDDIIICQPPTATYDLSQINNIVLKNQSHAIYGVSYFSSMPDAMNHTNLLPSVQTFTSQTTTVIAKVYRLSNFDCYSTTSFTVRLSNYPVLNPISDYYTCDDGILNDGIASFDVNSKTAEFLNNQSLSDFKVSYHLNFTDAQNDANPIVTRLNNTRNPQTIYARIATLPSVKCFHTTSFSLIVTPVPELNIKPNYTLCEGDGNSVSIILPNTFSDYQWSNGNQTNNFSTSEPGNYWVTVTQNTNGINCSGTSNFQVSLSNKATIKKIDFQNWTANENSITILIDAASLGDYEYSLDGIHYQDSNSFNGLIAKEYTVYVRDKNGCGISTDKVFLILYPKFFTPNDDGYNDKWNIQFSETEADVTVEIFDRYGKLITKTNSWDGNSDGNPLPADDYWFLIKRKNGKEYKGHFTLKR